MEHTNERHEMEGSKENARGKIEERIYWKGRLANRRDCGSKMIPFCKRFQIKPKKKEW